MKRFFYFTVLLTFVLLSNNSYSQYKMMGAYDTSCCAIPYYLTTPDTLSSCFLSRVHTSLPEGTSVYCFAPQDVAATAPTTLHLKDSGDVWLSFVGQGDWYENVLGFYTYPWGSPPSTISDTMVTIVFPNATLWGYGGALHPGFRVLLGHYPANTCFGFMLVGNGWHFSPLVTWRSDSFLAEGKYIYYSDPHLNPSTSFEQDTNRHVVGLYDEPSKLIVMGFEDQYRGNTWQPDNDFNDVLFYLRTNNPEGSFDTSGFPHTLITCDSGVSTGGDGGLESQNLGGKVAARDFENMKKGIIKDAKPNYKKMPVFNPNILQNERVTGSSQVLERFMPAQVYVPKSDTANSFDSVAATPYYSTPTDITSLTFAKDVLSVDYVLNNQAKAVALAITTLNKAYNHTKSICDRFRGATLVSADTIRIQPDNNAAHNFKFILFAMLQPDGTTEYSITFDIGKANTGSVFNLQSKWLISEYLGYDSVFNFQVWATNPGGAIKLARQMLSQILSIAPIQQVDTAFTLPQTYIANGKRNKGNLNITVTNLTNATTATIMLEENKNELAPVDTLIYTMPLTFGTTNTLSLPINDGYQYEGHLYINGVLIDDVYMADGNWSLDYDHSTTTMNSYVPGNESNRVYIDGEYPLYRSVAINAGISSYMYAYKYLTSGDEKVDLTSYHSLKFHAQGTGSVNVYLIKNGISGITNQYHTLVALNPTGQDYSISFNDFYSDGITDAFKANDVQAVVFAFNFDNIQTNLDFFAGSLSFSPNEVFSSRLAQSKSINITPNPNEGNFQCMFQSEESQALELAVSDVTGRIVYRQTINAAAGKNTLQITLPADIPKPSLLMITLENNKVIYSAAKMSYAK